MSRCQLGHVPLMVSSISGCVVVTILLTVLIHCGFCQLSDSILFSIDWPGRLPLGEQLVENPTLSDNELLVVTNNQEQYRCLLPEVIDNQKQDGAGMSPKHAELELLKPLFYQNSCTYRLESYWSYELCHGKHLRQYHEEKDKLQEYYLGRYSMDEFPSALENAKQALQNDDSNQKKSHKVRKVQGLEVPYYEVQYSDGTTCDLTGEARRIAVQYVCHTEGRGEIYEVKEVSSCEYEAVILTSLLCSHPSYGPKKEIINSIQCQAVNGSPKKPVNLELQELEDTVTKQVSEQEQIYSSLLESISNLLDKAAVASGGSTDIDADDLSDTTSASDDDEEEGSGYSGGYRLSAEPPRQTADKKIIKDFLSGTHCVQGGTGWWKHEFCYGKHVIQYHEDKSGRTEIVLGRWNEVNHETWIANNPRKKPKPAQQRGTLTHFYSDGEICDITGEKRFVEVRLKCSVNPNHPNSISLYLVEQQSCQYKLVVESQLLCSLIKEAEPNTGIIPQPQLL